MKDKNAICKFASYSAFLTSVVLQIIPELGAGGAEQSCIDVAIELKKAGSTPS